MSCENIPSVSDLEKTKLHVDDFGRLMGTGTGTSTNGVTGQVRPTYNKVINDMNAEFDSVMSGMGYGRVGTFTAGYTLENARQTLLWEVSAGGDGQEYGWTGAFPKIVPPNSTPATTGGTDVGAWMSRFDPELRNALVTFAGDIDEPAAWADVPKHSDPDLGDALDTQTKALVARSELLKTSGFAGFVFSDVAFMKATSAVGIGALPVEALASDQMARTMSYHGGWAAIKEPVGAATYSLTTLAKVRAVRGDAWLPDGYVDHYLSAGDGVTYVAVILTGDSISIEQAGAVPGNPAVDNYPAMQASLNWSTTTYGGARTVTAGVGEFYYSKTLLIESSQTNLGVCTGIVGAGWNKTYFTKTANTPIAGAEDYSVDAYIAYKTRSTTQSLYDYGSLLQHFTCKSAAPTKHQYGIYGKFLSHIDWEEIEVQSAAIGVFSHDAWMVKLSGVRAGLCGLGFKIGGLGTTLNWSNVWAHDCTNGGYEITGVVYSEWANCGADRIFDPINPTVNKVAYKFTNCQAIAMTGCGMEETGEAFYLDNSTINVTGFRVNSVRNGDAGQTLIRAVNNSGGSFETCGFTSVPAVSSIAVQSRDASSYLRFENCAFQIANSAVPQDANHRRNGLTTDMPLDVQGLKTVRLAFNGTAWRSATALKSNSGFRLISGVADGADYYLDTTKVFWGYNEISTNSSAPTVIGNVKDLAGTNVTSLLAYRAVDSYGVMQLYLSFSGAIISTFQIALHTAQHW